MVSLNPCFYTYIVHYNDDIAPFSKVDCLLLLYPNFCPQLQFGNKTSNPTYFTKVISISAFLAKFCNSGYQLCWAFIFLAIRKGPYKASNFSFWPWVSHVSGLSAKKPLHVVKHLLLYWSYQPISYSLFSIFL